jgi:hypothetical protein
MALLMSSLAGKLTERFGRRRSGLHAVGNGDHHRQLRGGT